MVIPASLAGLPDCRWRSCKDKFRNNGSDGILPIVNDGKVAEPVLCITLLEPLVYVAFHPPPLPKGSLPSWYIILFRILTSRLGAPPLIMKLPLLAKLATCAPQSYSVLL